MIIDHPMTQSEFIRKFTEQKREEFNPYFYERENKKIFKEVEKIILSCEREQYFTIKVVSFREIMDYREIRKMLYEHEEQRRAIKKKPPKNPNPYQFINIEDSDIMLLEVVYYLRINGDKPEEDYLTVLIELPRYVNKYYIRLAGKEYSLLFQIVDRSTYNNSGTNQAKYPCVTYRTQFMSVRILKKSCELVDYMSGEILQATVYDAFMFRKVCRAMKYLLAKYGLYGALVFLGIEKHVFILDAPMVKEDWYCFQKGDIYICTPKEIFKNSIIQSFIVTVYESIREGIAKVKKDSKKTEYDDIFNPKYWMSILSASFKDRNNSIEKGISILNSAETIYDITSKEITLLPDDCKDSIYHILRWLMREFNRKNVQDNLDITFKRCRLEEPIGSIYAIKQSLSIYRISDEGRHVTMKQLKAAIYTKPDYIITALIHAKVANFSDLVNDGDGVSALSYTFKGISGLGEEGQVQDAYRRLHPSHLKRFDLDSSSASDPGLTGILCPYGDIEKNGLFSNIEEPNYWEKEYLEMVDRYNKLVGMKEVIEFEKKQGFEYDHIKDDILQESIANIRKLIVPVEDINGKIDYTNPIADSLEMD